MSKPMRVALLQCPCGDLPAADHMLRLRRLLAGAARAGAQLAVFPELTNAPYFPARPGADAFACAEPVPGPFVRQVAKLAKEFGLAVIISLAERSLRGRVGKKPFLTAVLIDARGRVAGRYRKVHLPQFPLAREKQLFRAGDRGFRALRCRGLKLGMLLCYDRHFPEAARALALLGAAAIIIPSATPAGAAGSWLFELEALAFTNGCYVLAANRCGSEGELRFLGESCAVSPAGELLARAGAGEDMLLVDLDPAAAAASVARRAYLPDRVPAAYAAVARRARKKV